MPGGREYLARVPGVSTSPLGNTELAELMNWMFWRFDREHLPPDFVPFTAEELGRFRSRPVAARGRADANPALGEGGRVRVALMPAAVEILLTTCPRDCYDSCGIAVVRRGGEIHGGARQ